MQPVDPTARFIVIAEISRVEKPSLCYREGIDSTHSESRVVAALRNAAI